MNPNSSSRSAKAPEMLAVLQPNWPCTGTSMTAGMLIDAAVENMTMKVTAAITQP